MVLEIIGARYLAKDFGSSFYVWVSQIGIILVALALGYVIGGALADRFQRLSFLAVLLVPAGLMTFFIPNYAPRLINAIIMQHPIISSLVMLGAAALGLTTIFYYWGARGTPPPTSEQKRLLREQNKNVDKADEKSYDTVK